MKREALPLPQPALKKTSTASFPASKPSTTSLRTPGELTSVDLPEIAPFSQPLTSSSQRLTPPTSTTEINDVQGAPSTASVNKRMDEMFPDDDSDIIPNADAITNILDRILPKMNRTKALGHMAIPLLLALVAVRFSSVK